MTTPKHEQIVFDIIDELTDESDFAKWWFDLPDNKRATLLKTLENRTKDNLKPNIPRRRIMPTLGPR